MPNSNYTTHVARCLSSITITAISISAAVLGLTAAMPLLAQSSLPPTSMANSPGVAATQPVIPNVDTTIRHLRSTVYSVAGRTNRAARRLRDTAQSMQYNHIGTAQQVSELSADATELTILARQPDGQTMQTVRAKLGAALYGNTREKDVLSAMVDQGIVLERLDKIIKRLHTLVPAALADNINALIHQQKRLKQQTADLFKMTIGESRTQLSSQQKSQLRRNALKQRKLGSQMRNILRDLKKADRTARQMSRLRKAQAYSKAIAMLKQADVTRQTSRSADDIERNRLTNAARRQQKVIDALTEARRLLQSRGQFQESQLYQQLQETDKLQAAEKNLLQRTQDMAAQPQAAQFQGLQMRQSQITAGINRMHIEPAAGPAKNAEQQLGQGQRKRAEGSMKQTLAALQGEQQRLLAMLGGRSLGNKGKGKKTMANPHGTMVKSHAHRGANSKLVNGQQRSFQPGLWRIPLTGAEKKTIDTAAAQRFPARYRAALEAYYRNLATGASNGEKNAQ